MGCEKTDCLCRPRAGCQKDGSKGSADAHQVVSSGRVSGKAAAAEERGVSVQVWRDALCPLQQHAHLLVMHSNTTLKAVLLVITAI